MCEPAAPLPDDLDLCHEIIRQQADTIQESQRRIEQLEHQVELLLRRQYGPRRESVDPDQLRLFTDDAPEDLAEGTTEEPPEPEGAKPKRRWRRRGRQTAPRGPAPEADRVRAVRRGIALPGLRRTRTKIGEEVSEQLEYVPSSLLVIQHARFRYACRACQEHVAIADKPPQPIDKGLPGPGLLAQTITSKYSRSPPALPARRHLRPPRGGAVAGHALRLDGLLRRAAHAALRPDGQAGVALDRSSTPTTPRCRCWTRRCRKTRTGRFWVYIGDVRNPYVVYDYTPRRTRDGPERFLEGIPGLPPGRRVLRLRPDLRRLRT